MDSFGKIVNDLSSPHFWVTAGFFALLVNLASSYIKPYLDKWYERYSTKQKFKNNAERAKFVKEAKMLASSPTQIQILGLYEQRERAMALYVSLLGIFVANFPKLFGIEGGFEVFCLAFSLAALVLGKFTWNSAEEKHKLIHAALTLE